jgi:hypothetical protein
MCYSVGNSDASIKSTSSKTRQVGTWSMKMVQISSINAMHR